MTTSDDIMEENMDRFELINGIMIDKEQVKLFIERLTRKYAGWEIEDILSCFINKDIGEFEEFVTGEQAEHIAYLEDKVDELERSIEEYKRKGNPKEVDDLEKDYLRIIKEQRAALAALGASHLRFGQKDVEERIREDVIRPWRSDINVGATE